MSDGEVLELALLWMNKCKCVDHGSKPKPGDYPTRLLDLSELKVRGGYIDPHDWKYYGSSGLDDQRNAKIKLVETSKVDWCNMKNRHPLYVTLSHKWGGNKNHIKLTLNNKKAFEEGLRLNTLPRTFQDAITFATRLYDVGYIWIDSLCIIQDGDGGNDWLRESALMHKVYRNSFLNISATAADNSDEGLFSAREPHHLWEDIISVNINGLPKDNKSTGAATNPQSQRLLQSDSHEPLGVRPESASGHIDPSEYDLVGSFATIRSCFLLDVSVWETLVNQAPVNKRGWVVQERLIAPRVLHFCQGRIAWECQEFEDIEGRAPGMPNFQLIDDEICEAVPVKELEPTVHGERLRRSRLRGTQDSHHELRQDPTDTKASKTVQSLELWARVVEMYSRTHLTQERDRLIALTGIASQMAANIGSKTKPAEYIAGMWRTHMISQLLWKVEPVFRGVSDAGVGIFEYPSKRPRNYRAPSFSWASVDAQDGNGITYGEVLDDDDVFVAIPSDKIGEEKQADIDKSVWVEIETDNEFGLVAGGHILLQGWMCRAKLYKLKSGFLYCWRLQGGSEARLDKEEHLSVYLDCPDKDDENNGLTLSESIYCLPVARGPAVAKKDAKDIICLLLEQVPASSQTGNQGRHLVFRRIGITKLDSSLDPTAWTYLMERLIDTKTTKSLIRII